jgi:antitoxin PrlF
MITALGHPGYPSVASAPERVVLGHGQTTFALAAAVEGLKRFATEEIRRALHISEGDEVEFSVHDDGTITVRGYVSIPTDQAWFFSPQWLAGEREADEQIAAGRGTVHESADDMFAHLDALDADA